MAILLYLGTTLIVFLTAAIIWVYRKMTYWNRVGVPNPGFFAQFSLYKNRQAGDVEVELYKKYGPIYGSYIFLTPIMVIGTTNHIKDICIKDFSKFRNHTDFPSPDRRLSQNMFILRDDHWKRLRSVLTPMFSLAKLKTMSDSIIPCVDTFIENMLKLNGSPISIKKYLDCLNMDVIVSVAYGLKVDCLNDPNNELVTQAKKIFTTIAASIGLFGSRFVDTSCFDYISNLTMQIVEQRRKDNIASGGKSRSDFLQTLVDAKYNPDGPTLTDDEICAFGISFFSDGFETTALALTGMAYYLAKNSDMQKKLAEEVNAISNVNLETVSTLKYLDAVFKETMRIWPPGYRIDRCADVDYKLEGTDFVIPKGMTINFPLYAIQRDPEIFENPNEFKPSRFLGSESASLDSLSILAFGSGPRACVAQRFATLNVKLTAARLLQKVRFEATKDTKLENIEGEAFFVFPKDVYLRVVPK